MSSRDFYPLNDYDRQEIAKLPPDIAALADKYPCEIVNVVDGWDDEPFPDNYVPQYVEIYSDAGEEASLCILDGVLTDYTPANPEINTSTVQVIIDGKFAYVEIEGRVIINHLGGVILPEIAVNPSSLLQVLVKESDHD
jgi:hypothetical protein